MSPEGSPQKSQKYRHGDSRAILLEPSNLTVA
jgi:hypothetical protein